MSGVASSKRKGPAEVHRQYHEIMHKRERKTLQVKELTITQSIPFWVL